MFLAVGRRVEHARRGARRRAATQQLLVRIQNRALPRDQLLIDEKVQQSLKFECIFSRIGKTLISFIPDIEARPHSDLPYVPSPLRPK